MKTYAFDGLSSVLVRRMQRFAQAEHGAMAPIVLVFFFLMLVLGGIAVDVMRFETKRVAVQNTLDRAALGVANMTSALVTDSVHTTRAARAQYIVEDYFNKAGLSEHLQYVRLDDGANYRVVEARATVVSHNIFMNLLGLPVLQAAGASIAEQRITDIEIMLVLDVSGSMSNNSKLANLKIAANDFIDQVKDTDTENRISIGIVPYNAQVNLGDELASKYNLINQHRMPNSNCVELPISSQNFYSNLPMSRTTPMRLMTVADTQTTFNDTDSDLVLTLATTPQDNANQRWCNPSMTTEIRLPTKSKAEAKAGINALRAEGNTSIFLGMRWATALIDPSARGIYSELISEGHISSNMSGRPFDYNDPATTANNVLKVIVLMTDGEHVQHQRIFDNYKTGPATNLTFTYTDASNRSVTVTPKVWRSNSTGAFSVEFPSKSDGTCNARPFWDPAAGTWTRAPVGATAVGCYNQATPSYPGASIAQWEQIWSSLRMQYAFRQLYARGLARSPESTSSNSTVRTRVHTAVMNQVYDNTSIVDPYAPVAAMNNLLAVNCNAAKNQGILVYGIAFMAPAAGRTAIQSCTSTPTSTYYFDVAETAKIQDAFRMIATNLSQLRLTQ